jgi:hypothetical protein
VTPLLVPALVVGTLIPGGSLGLALGRAGMRAEGVAALIFCSEIAASWAIGTPCFGVSAYVLLAGRAAYRLDPCLRAFHPGLHAWGDIEVPLSAPGIFAGAALAFGLQVAAAVALAPKVAPMLVRSLPYAQQGLAFAVFGVFAILAWALDRQHAAALSEAGALRGCTGPALLPHLSAAEHLELARSPASEAAVAEARVALKAVLHRRPRHLDAAQRALLAGLFARVPG